MVSLTRTAAGSTTRARDMRKCGGAVTAEEMACGRRFGILAVHADEGNGAFIRAARRRE
jgi:hypothetical protein